MSKQKEYPLLIEYCTEFEGCATTDYHSKGHQDSQKFVEAVKGDYGYDCNIKAVMHCFAKLVPAPNGGMFMQYDFMPCRGSFPVTVVEL